LFLHLAERVSQPVWIALQDGAWEYANPNWQDYTGLSLDDSTGLGWTQAVHLEDVADCKARWLQGTSGSAPFELEFRARATDGTYRWFNARAERLAECAGSEGRWLAVAIQVEGPKALEGEVDLLPEERFRASVETLLDCFGVFTAVRDPAGRIVDFRIDYLNAAACRNNRRTLQEQVGKRLLELLPAHIETGLFDAYCRVVETGEPFDRVMQFYADNYNGRHEARWFDIRASRLGDGFVAAWRDITERVAEQKAAEDQLRESESRFRTMADGLPLMIWVHDAAGEQEFVNRTFCEFFGIRPEQAAGSGWQLLMHPEDGPAYTEAFLACVRERRPFHAEVRVRNAQGEWRRIESWARPRFSDAGEFRGFVGTSADVTEQHAAHEALKRRELTFRRLAEANLVGVCFSNSKGVMSWVNDEMLRMMSRSRADFDAGRVNCTDCIPMEFRGEHERLRERLLRDGYVSGYESAFLKPDGTRTPFLGAMVRVKPGDDVHICVALDLSAIRAAQAAVLDSEERLRFALRCADAGAWDWDILSGAIVWSEGNYRLYAVDPAQGPPTYAVWEGKVHPEDRARANAAVEEVVSGRVSEFRVEFRVIPEPGRERWLLALGRAERAQDGTALRMVGINLDITERKQAELALEATEARLRLALEASQTGIWTWDMRTDAVTWTREAYAIHGIAEDAFDGTAQGFGRLVHPDDAERVWQTAHAAVAARTYYSCEFRIIRPSGEVRWVSNLGRATYDPAGSPERMTGTITDITERKRAEQVLREADRRKNEFLATLAHELRGPLAPLRMGLHLLGAAADPETAEQTRDMMNRQVVHLARLIDDLLDVSRISRGKLELRRARVPLAEILEHAQEMVRPHVESRGHEVAMQLPAEPVELYADPVRLAQVFSNLLHNACKYSDKGGRIAVRVTRQGPWAVVLFKDEGIGIAPEDLPYVFGLFSQVAGGSHRAQGGLGIGLSLARSLVEMHGGTISAHSEGAGMGSQFTVSLPVADAGS
jgi:PAS domain S-box-containing protein